MAELMIKLLSVFRDVYRTQLGMYLRFLGIVVRDLHVCAFVL